jgi:hypothetical protein
MVLDFAGMSEAFNKVDGKTFFVKDIRLSALEKMSMVRLRARLAEEGAEVSVLKGLEGTQGERDELLAIFRHEVLPEKYPEPNGYFCHSRDGHGKYLHANAFFQYEGSYTDGLKHGEWWEEEGGA